MWAWFCPGLKGMMHFSLSSWVRPGVLAAASSFSCGGAVWSGTHWSCCPLTPLPLTPALADEQSLSEPVQGAPLVGSWYSIHPSYFLLCLLHPKKAQMLQLLQGRIGSQQGRLRAIWIAMEVQSVFWGLLMHSRLSKKSSNPAMSFLRQFESGLVFLPALY